MYGKVSKNVINVLRLNVDQAEKKIISDMEVLSNRDTVNPLNNEQKFPVYTFKPETFNEFTYSKKSHLIFFSQKNYDSELFGRKINEKDCTDNEYQILLIYAFIKTNLRHGARILEINNSESLISNKVEMSFKYWHVNNLDNFTGKIKNGNVSDSHINSTPSSFNNNFYHYFDFIFSTTLVDMIGNNGSQYSMILFNLSRLLKPGGYSIHNFSLNSAGKEKAFESIRTIFFNNSLYDNKPVNKFKNRKRMQSDNDVLYLLRHKHRSGKSFSLRNKLFKSNNLISSSILFKKDYLKLTPTITSKSSLISKQYPVYIFHHIIKCGGQALSHTMKKWFNIYFDNLKGPKEINNFIKFKYNVHNLVGDSCISGHFGYEGIFPHQRYPEVFENLEKFRIFVFMREPLQIRISLYYYLKTKNPRKGKPVDYSLESFLSGSDNLISRMIPCNESNYKEVLDKYFFIGIVEHMQESMDKLALLIGKKRIKVKVANKSIKDSQISELNPTIIEKFKENNKLDYMIYDYCLERFNNS